MFRSSVARLRSLVGPQRKLFLLVFLWTCLCLLVFRATFLSSSQANLQTGGGDKQKFRTRSASADYGAASSQSNALSLELAPEFALPDNGNSNAVYYSLSSALSTTSMSQPVVAAAPPHRQSQVSDTTNKAAKHEPPRRKPQQQQHLVKAAGEQAASNFVTGSQCNYDYPSLFDLQFNNIHWQKLTTSSTTNSSATGDKGQQRQQQQQASSTYYLYNAYYDDRWRGGLPSVRVLAMIDKIQPPPTNCLLWSSKLKHSTGDGGGGGAKRQPLVTRASFVYAWYPKWGNYKDGILQPWIVTCTIPRAQLGFVPDSVSLVGVPTEMPADEEAEGAEGAELHADEERNKRDASAAGPEGSPAVASMAMPPSFSSSSPALAYSDSSSSSAASSAASTQANEQQQTKPMKSVHYDCKRVLPITNNLPVFNSRPKVKQKFAVCVKGLDFPHDDVSVRLVEWIEMLNLLGAGKIFLYSLDVHENISKVLHYYEKRGLVELSPLTLPGDQPNLPEYQHLYLKNRLTAKRQNELIPYNDCLYRNLYSYQYLALLDIDEIIMPLKREHNNWLDLMQEVEWASLYEQNYSRASYNVRNVYFFDDLSGPLGTTAGSTTTSLPATTSGQLTSPSAAKGPHDGSTSANDYNDLSAAGGGGGGGAKSNARGEEEPEEEQENEQEAFDDNNRSHSEHPESLERGIPHYLHMMSHVYRSKNYTEPGQYVKCFHNTERVVSLHNHFPMNCFGQCTTYSIPVSMAHLQHYRKDCVGPLKQSCKNNFRVFTTRDTTIWKYKQRMIRRTTRVLNQLGLLSSSRNNNNQTV